MAGRNIKCSITKRTKKARGAARKTVRGVFQYSEKDLVAGLDSHKAHADALDSRIAKKRGKRLRNDSLWATRQIRVIKRLVGAGLRRGGSVVLVSRRTDAGKPRTTGKPRTKMSSKRWDAFHAMLDRPARRNPRLARLLKTKPPWE